MRWYIVVLSLSLAGCQRNPGVDLVRAIEPVSQEFEDIDPALNKMAASSLGERFALLTEYNRDVRISQRLVWLLRDKGKISSRQKVVIVEMFFGSLFGIRGEDAKGVIHHGFLKNQLLAHVVLREGERAADWNVVVRTQNRFFPQQELREAGLQRMWDQAPHEDFTVTGSTTDLKDYVGHHTAIYLAKQWGLPIVFGQGKKAKIISPEEALKAEPGFSRDRIHVPVAVGDHFDLVAQKYTSAWPFVQNQGGFDAGILLNKKRPEKHDWKGGRLWEKNKGEVQQMLKELVPAAPRSP